MKRRVILIGPRTLCVSIPAKWAQKFNIQKGDEIELEEFNEKIVISTKKISPVIKTVTIDITKLGQITKRVFDSLYKKGYDEIKIIYSDPKELEPIEKSIGNEAKSFEIITQEKNTCVTRSISEMSEDDFKNILKRVFFVLIEMSNGLINALKEEDFDRITAIKLLERTNNKLTQYLRRFINREGYKEHNNFAALYTIIEGLEKIADEYKYLCDTFSEIREVNDNIIAALQETHSFLVKYYELFYSYKEEQAISFYKQRKDIVSNLIGCFKKCSRKEFLVYHHILNITSLTFDLFGPLLVMKY